MMIWLPSFREKPGCDIILMCCYSCPMLLSLNQWGCQRVQCTPFWVWSPLSSFAVWPVAAPRHPEPWGRPTEFGTCSRTQQPVVSPDTTTHLTWISLDILYVLYLKLQLLFIFFPFRTEVMFMATRELLRIPQAALAKPISIPTNLVSLFSRYVDRQKLNLLETKLQ